jgi:PPOX class probable F420-dependent enzyme
MPASLSEGVKKLFSEPNFAHVATLMPDGSPQVTPVWVDLKDGRILVNTAEGRVKPRNVRRDPRVAVSITSQSNPYSAAFIRGRVVEVTHEGADELIDKLAKKYIGQDRYPWRQPGEQRVVLVIEPEHVSSMMAD